MTGKTGWDTAWGHHATTIARPMGIYSRGLAPSAGMGMPPCGWKNVAARYPLLLRSERADERLRGTDLQRVQTTCDNPIHGDRAPECEPTMVLLPTMVLPREIDLCNCVEDLTVRQLRELLNERGRKGDTALTQRRTARRQGAPPPERPVTPAMTVQSRQYPCLVCRDVLPTVSKLSGHYRARHGLPPGWLTRAITLTVCPLCPDTVNGGGPLQCNTAVALATHARTAHNMYSHAALLRHALDTGDDPYGVVARQLATLKKTAGKDWKR